MLETALDYLADLITAPSPSGNEKAAAERFRAYVGPYVHTVSTDVHGNTTAVINPAAKTKIMLSGHMDEIGFIVHHIGTDGLLHFSAVGGNDAPVPIGQQVWVHGRERLPGAVGRKAIHLMSPSELKKAPELSELWIDIGASSREEAEKVVSLGDYVTYQHEFRRLLGDRITGRALDNKVGLFIVSEALRILSTEGGLHPEVGVHALGSVQEEIGSRGARSAAARIGAVTGLAVDMEQATDYRGADPVRHGTLTLGKGASISCGPNTNPVVLEKLIDAAKVDQIAYQLIVAASTTPTDEKAMQIAAGGMATGLVGVPLRYMHTPCEVISLADVENCSRLVAGFCRRVAPEDDFRPF